MENVVKICNIRKFLMEEATKTILVALVLSHLDYANEILPGLHECDINKMQKIEYMAVKLATRVRKHDSTVTHVKFRGNSAILSYFR